MQQKPLTYIMQDQYVYIYIYIGIYILFFTVKFEDHERVS